MALAAMVYMWQYSSLQHSIRCRSNNLSNNLVCEVRIPHIANQPSPRRHLLSQSSFPPPSSLLPPLPPLAPADTTGS